MKEFIVAATITGADKTLKERRLSFFTNNSFQNNKYVSVNHTLLVATWRHKLGMFPSHDNKED